MPIFLAVVSKGLHEIAESEVRKIGLTVKERTGRGVYFESSWEGCYRANLQLRTVSRILQPVLDFPAYKPEDLYFNAKKHDFTKYITPTQTLAVDAKVLESVFQDQRFVALKTKDAIVDQFWEKFGKRPDIDKENPDLKVVVAVIKNQVTVSIDTSGQPLYKRGYRTGNFLAPLKETLAAGLLALMEWDELTPLVDPMCGSGTFLIEAALQAAKIAPGLLRKGFAFQKWKTFQPDAFQRALDDLSSLEHSPDANEGGIHFYGFDRDRAAISQAKENARRAGVDHLITFRRESIDLLEPPIPKGILIMNPPYGERLGLEDRLKDTYRDLEFTLKNRFKGWECWILSGNRDLTKMLHMKATKKFFVYNGPLECRFLRYQIF